MQLVSLIMVFLSSYHQTASTALILVVVTWASIPAKLKSGVNTQIRKRFFKPKVCIIVNAGLFQVKYAYTVHMKLLK